MRDLSVIIPARNEEFLKRTVNDVLAKAEADTEVIIISDGDWPLEPIANDDRIILIKTGSSIGQRAAVNLGARLSTAKFIMKLDAHCIVDQGFDRKLMADCKYNWTVIPAMYNLHAFNWKCAKCGKQWYQSPTPTFCHANNEGIAKNPDCDNTTDFERVMVWKKRDNRRSEFMRFDKELHFQYWNEYKNRPEAQGDIVDVMSNLGACFFMHRERYWDLDGLDENHGSWGQMGTEIACKSWLSGGRHVVNKKTWFSHLFRTQGGDFGFPYDNPQKNVEKARKYSQNMWRNNTWPKAIKTLDWLVEKFKPVPGWHKYDQTKKLTKGVVYYTDNTIDDRIGDACREQLLKGIKEKHIVSVSLSPINFGHNIVLPLERGYLTMAKQILAGLKASTADVIYFAEHDVLYHPSYFDFLPFKKDVYYYNTNVWQVRASDGHALYTDNCRKLSQLCAYRDTLITHFEKRVELLEKAITRANVDMGMEWFNKYVRQMGFEPGTHKRAERVDDLPYEDRRSLFASLDIRHDTNVTPSRWNKDQYRNKRFTEGWKEADQVEGWPVFKDIIDLR